jgi:hypothetical protein
LRVFLDRQEVKNARKEVREQKAQGQKSLPEEGCQEPLICPKKILLKETNSDEEEDHDQEVVA